MFELLSLHYMHYIHQYSQQKIIVRKKNAIFQEKKCFHVGNFNIFSEFFSSHGEKYVNFEIKSFTFDANTNRNIYVNRMAN